MNFLKTLTLSAFIAASLITPSLANEINASGSDAAQVKPLEISTPSDLTLSCGELFSEAINMTDIIQATQDIKSTSEMKSHGITAAGAIGSLLIGTATGGIGLALGGFLMNHNVEERSDKADEIQDIAAQRRTLMLGIHNAKGCYGPTEYIMQPPQSINPIGQIALSDNKKHTTKARQSYNK